MPAGAVHPNTGNFSRVPRLSVVDRVRKLVAQKAYEKRPEWLQFVERAPPMELINLKLRDNRVKSPYPEMIQYVLGRFPDMRFQDCFVDGNDWSKGNDRYRADHPVMQFVARQLQLINQTGMTRKEAFEKTKQEYLVRRKELEKMQKLEMALAQNNRIVPAFETVLFTSGAGIARQREAELGVAHLNHIRRKLRMLRKEIEPHDKRRMNAKEMALDIELERTSLLPRMTDSAYKDTSQEPLLVESVKNSDEKGAEASASEWEEEPFSFEFLSENEPEFESQVFEPSVLHDASRGRKPKPLEVGEFSWETMGEKVWKSELIESGTNTESLNLKKDDSVKREPIVRTKPAFTLSRPDKQTVQAILAKKQKEELRKRIGKEPGESGDDDQLDFEDFINMIKNQK